RSCTRRRLGYRDRNSRQHRQRATCPPRFARVQSRTLLNGPFPLIAPQRLSVLKVTRRVTSFRRLRCDCATVRALTPSTIGVGPVDKSGSALWTNRGRPPVDKSGLSKCPGTDLTFGPGGSDAYDGDPASVAPSDTVAIRPGGGLAFERIEGLDRSHR